MAGIPLKQTPFLIFSMCILRDLPQLKNPRALCPGELPQIYMFPCSHGNISFLRNEKEVRQSKESCFT